MIHDGGDLKVGRWVRRLRKKRGISQMALAKQTGLTAGFLSQLENDKRAASASTLRMIVHALDCYSLSEFLAMVEQGEHPVHSIEDRVVVAETDSLKVEYIGPRDGRSFNSCLLWVEMQPGYEALEAASDPEEKLFLVLRGKLGIMLDGEDHEVGSGEACFVNAFRPHRLRNLAHGVTRYAQVLTATGRTEWRGKLAAREAQR